VGLTGAMLLLGGWLLLGSLTTSGLIPPIPRLSSDGPVVRNGVVAIVACGKKRGIEVVSAAPESGTGTWGVERKGECNVYYHRPPDPSAPSRGPAPPVGSNRKPSVLTSDQYDTR
jgi:hypothetical protein